MLQEFFVQTSFFFVDELLFAKQFSQCAYIDCSLFGAAFGWSMLRFAHSADTTEPVSSSAHSYVDGGERASLLYKLSGETYISFSSITLRNFSCN
jgi:hypothetical protein